MKKLVLIWALLLCFISVNAQTNNTYTISSGGVVRSYILYVPRIYNPLKPTPLVFNFHSRRSTSSQQELYADFTHIADTANFIMVLPQGLTTNGITGFSDVGTVASVSVDINFTSELIDTISAHYNINPCKIYSTGFSNGGAMSYDLACFLSSRFAAVASVAGGMIASHAAACNPTHPMPVMAIHGTADDIVYYNGGQSADSINFMPIDTVVKLWVGLGNCTPRPSSVVAVPNSNATDRCSALHYVYNNRNISSVELYKVIEGGHSWPGSVYQLRGTNTNEDFSASAVIWQFFRKYCLSTVMGVDEIEKQTINFNLYPNPANGLLNFSLNKPTDDVLNIEVLDVLGKQVLSEKTTNNFIAVDKLNAGIYFLYVTQNNKSLAKVKFIKE